MPDPNLNTPPDVGAWTKTESVATETPPVQPETAPTTEPVAPVDPTEPTPSEQTVAALVKGGMTEPDAQKLLESARTPQPIKDALEAFLDGKPYPVPKNLTFKLKSGATITERTLEDLQRGGLREADYTKQTQQLARERREHTQQVAQWSARDAALKEREKWFEEQRNEMLAAQKDPKKWEEYQEVLRLRAASPTFDKLYQDAMKAREDGASRGVLEKAMEEQEINAGVAQAVDWIRDLASEYPGVNPERVRVILAYAWQREELPLDQESVRRVYEGEMDYLRQGPGAQELAALKAEIDALKAVKDAEAHNAKTDRALQRGKAPNLAPAGGGPPAPAKFVEPKPIPPDRRAQEEAISAWSKVRE